MFNNKISINLIGDKDYIILVFRKIIKYFNLWFKKLY